MTRKFEEFKARYYELKLEHNGCDFPESAIYYAMRETYATVNIQAVQWLAEQLGRNAQWVEKISKIWCPQKETESARKKREQKEARDANFWREWAREADRRQQAQREEYDRQRRQHQNRQRQSRSNSNHPNVAAVLKTLELTNLKDLTAIKAAFKRLALKHHPDRGGKEEDFKALNNAYQAALQYHTAAAR